MTVELPVDEPAPPCIQCGYNLTGLTSPRCPECGWVIDWELARASDEARRPGTPVYQARGRARWLAIPATVLLMLFRPIQFARRLRHDEPLWPAIAVAVSAYIAAFYPDALKGSYVELRTELAYFGAILTCIACSTVWFVILTISISSSLAWGRRLRLFLLVSLYSSFFIASWRLVDGPPFLDDWQKANFLWPANHDIGNDLVTLVTNYQFAGRTVLFYWWIAILLVFGFVRMRSSWRAAVFLSVPFLAARLAPFAGELIYDALRF